MEQPPIISPPNPYVGNIRIYPGTLIRVAGRPRPNAGRFAINLQTGPSLNPRDDLALHLSPCFSPPRIIRNSLQRGAWGLEEAWGNGTPINPYQSFEIIILAEAEQFKVAVNGAHFCEFRHRIPYQQITHLTIDGDVDIERISITASQPPQPTAYTPSAPTSSSSTGPYPPYSSAPGMPQPSFYPTLTPGAGVPSSHYPGMPAGPTPTPTPASYASGYPPAGPYPQPSHMGGPVPAGGSYQGGYPQQHPHNQPQPGHSSSSPFGSLPIGNKALGTIAGLGLAGAAGAAILSAANPIKHAKKLMKPHKLFKHKHSKGWGGKSSSSSNSSISSRSSFSSNSS